MKRLSIILILLAFVLISTACSNRDRGDLIANGGKIEAGQVDNSKINEADIEADIEIHYSIVDGKVEFDNYDIETIRKVKKGDVIAFIEDNQGSGKIEDVSYNEGIEQKESHNNYFTVTESGVDIELEVKLNSKWYTFKFRSLREDIADFPKGVPIYEDFLVYVDNDYLFGLGDFVEEFIEYYGEGDIKDVNVSPVDENLIFYKYGKNGIIVSFYDNPDDDDYIPLCQAIALESPGHSTYRGLQIGDSYDKVLELYGETDFFTQYGDYIIYEYYYAGENYRMSLYINVDKKADKVISIHLGMSL